jgi:hypothetical protein
MATNLIQTISNKRSFTIYYDSEVVTSDVWLSISLVLNGTDEPGLHWNSTFDQSTSQKLGILISARPDVTPIIGSLKVKNGAILTYHIDPLYDSLNLYNYTWSVNNANIISSTDKTVTVQFNSDGIATISLYIENAGGCSRTLELEVKISEVVPKSMLVVRNRLA